MKKRTPDNPDSFLGYAKQIYRGLFYLLKKRANVYIEKNDDIYVYDDYGFLVLEQVKDLKLNKLTATNPNFLDTILNWANIYTKHKNKFNDRTKCILALLLKNQTDDLIMSCELAKTDKECEKAYLNILAKIKSSKDTSYSQDFQKYKSAILKIIKIFEIEKPIISAKDDCEQEIKNFLQGKISKERVKNYSDQILGWFLKATVNIENKQLREVHVTFDDLCQKCFQLNGETIHVNYPDISQLEKSFDEHSKMYVRQLELLNLDEIFINEAIEDFLSWDYLLNNDFKDGRVTSPEINKMYNNLCSRWRVNKLDLEYQCSGIEMGRRLYIQSLKEPVQILGVSIYGDPMCISRGVHNYLADNIDKYNIGWHPNFKELLDDKKS